MGGAVDALQAAERRDEVVGAVAIDLLADFRDWRHHAVHYGTRLLRWESWKSTLLLRNGAIERAARAAFGGLPSVTGSGLDAWAISTSRSYTAWAR